VDLEERSLDPVVRRHCEECGTRLTQAELMAVLEGGGPFLCSVHAAELADDEVEEPDV
jgi:hypothetical protein